MFATFVELAGSPNQVPTPAVPGAQFFQDEIIRAAEDAMYKLTPPDEALKNATRRVQARLEAIGEE
jgi:ABC-type glycerol-3-phosphate transport system substrate-binding protein